MKLEHIAIDVPDPEAFIAWWCENLGFRRSSPELPFIMDDSGTAGLEVYRASTTPAAPDYRRMDSMTLHIAFDSKDVKADHDRLVAAGATSEKLSLDNPDFHLAMLRDPWGVTIQLCKRKNTIFIS